MRQVLGHTFLGPFPDRDGKPSLKRTNHKILRRAVGAIGSEGEGGTKSDTRFTALEARRFSSSTATLITRKPSTRQVKYKITIKTNGKRVLMSLKLCRCDLVALRAKRSLFKFPAKLLFMTHHITAFICGCGDGRQSRRLFFCSNRLRLYLFMGSNKPSTEYQQRHLEKYKPNDSTHDNLTRRMEVPRGKVTLDGYDYGQNRRKGR